MSLNTITVNETVKLYFKAAPGISDYSNVKVLNNGALVTSPSISVTTSAIAGIYTVTYTPATTGRGVIIFEGEIVAHIEVVTKSIYSFLKNIEDESMGSWTWNKQDGKLAMIRQDGTPLADFDVVETLTVASRERTS